MYCTEYNIHGTLNTIEKCTQNCPLSDAILHSEKVRLISIDKYQESHPLGSPVEKDRFSDIYKKLKIALFELTFMDG